MANQYTRFFISLTPDRMGYGFKGREPSGRAVIEVRNGFGKITVTAQDIKPETVYKAYIVAGGRNATGVLAGAFRVDPRGRGELKWEFNPNNIEKSGISIDEIDVVAVACQGKSETHWVLTGYKNEVVRFKENFKLARAEEKIEASPAEVKTEAAEPEAVELKQEIQAEEITTGEPEQEIEATQAETESPDTQTEEPTQEIEAEEYEAEEETDYDEPEEEVETTEDIHEGFRAMARSFNEKFDELESLLVIKPEPAKKIEAAEEPKPKREPLTELDKIFAFNAEMRPFKIPAPDIRWVRISPKELVFLNLNYWNYMNTAFVHLGYIKHHHLLLGERREGDKKKYILGVPEDYAIDSVREAARLGFRLFKTGDDTPPERIREGIYGYWLMEL